MNKPVKWKFYILVIEAKLCVLVCVDLSVYKWCCVYVRMADMFVAGPRRCVSQPPMGSAQLLGFL